MNVESWINLAEHAALSDHMQFHEDGFEVLDPDHPEEDHGEVLHGMYVSGCISIEQDRLTAEKAEELRRRAQDPS
jgi:hypothetical protein